MRRAEVPRTTASLSSIGEVAETLQLTLRAIRFYESRGLVRPIRSGTQRLFTDVEIERLRFIKQGKRLRFSLAEIRDMLDEARCKGRLLVDLPLPKIEQQRGYLIQERHSIDMAIRDLDAKLTRQTTS